MVSAPTFSVIYGGFVVEAAKYASFVDSNGEPVKVLTTFKI